MKLKPNRTVIEGTVLSIVRADDGIGATVELQVIRSLAVESEPDFVAARAGQVLALYAAVPEELRVGGSYRVVTALAGGPHAQRLVVQSVSGEITP